MKYEIESNGKFLLGSFLEVRYLLHASVFKRGQMVGILNIIEDTNEGGKHGTNCMGNR
jgi:hypothetical protein